MCFGYGLAFWTTQTNSDLGKVERTDHTNFCQWNFVFRSRKGCIPFENIFDFAGADVDTGVASWELGVLLIGDGADIGPVAGFGHGAVGRVGTVLAEPADNVESELFCFDRVTC